MQSIGVSSMGDSSFISSSSLRLPSSSSPTPNTPRTTRRRRLPVVKFDNHVTGCFIEPKSVSEISALFYSREDYIQMNGECKGMIKLLCKLEKKSDSLMPLAHRGRYSNNENENDDDKNNICLRGLESYTKKGKKRKETRRRHAQRAVLEEQRRQSCRGRSKEEATIPDDEAIAHRYNIFCVTSAEEAIQRGLQDAAEVLQFSSRTSPTPEFERPVDKLSEPSSPGSSRSSCSSISSTSEAVLLLEVLFSRQHDMRRVQGLAPTGYY